jgi:5-methylcytosine-specific restriction endonuclease McrA
VLLEDLAWKAVAQRCDRPTGAGSRHIPVRVQRAVWLRDDGQCAFVARSGRRCSARHFLEFHHLRPFAVGGEATLANLELHCRAHNAYEAGLFYGPLRDVSRAQEQARPVSAPSRPARASPG